MGLKKFEIGAFGTNTYLITKGDKAVIVDPGMDFISILDEVNKYQIEAILITHGHVDHIDGCGYIDAPLSRAYHRGDKALRRSVVAKWARCICKRYYRASVSAACGRAIANRKPWRRIGA